MSTSLVPGLSFGPNLSSLPPAGQLLLITDHLASPADFILHRALALQLKNTASHPQHVILLSIASDFTHWSAIAAKSNINLNQHLKARSLTYIDGLSLSAYRSTPLIDSEKDGYVRCSPLFSTGSQEPSLRGLYDIIAQSLLHVSDESLTSKLLILDDITILELIGVPSITVTRFIRALRALCRRHSTGLIVRAHVSPSSDADSRMPFDSDILRTLIDVCHAHVEVRPLASGRSGAVSGEIAVHTGDDMMNEGRDEVGMGRKRSVHYRLNDGGAVFFQKGMGTSVL